MSATKYPNGVNNANPDSALGQLMCLDPTRLHVFFNDFDVYAAGDWTVTETQAGATQALTDGDGGLLLLTNTNTDDDLLAMQLVKESFLPAALKKLWFKMRFQVNLATQIDVLVGLHVTDTSPIATAPSQGIYFRKDDGDTNIDFVVAGASATTTASAIATLADATWLTLGFYYDPIAARIYYFKDDVCLGAVASTNLPATELALSFCIQHGEVAGTAKTMTVDYIFAAKER